MDGFVGGVVLVARGVGLWFVRGERAGSVGGGLVVCLLDGAPVWLRDAVVGAHDDMLPDDYVYGWFWEAVGRVAEEGDGLSFEGLEDVGGEFAADADIYGSELLKWAGSHVRRLVYCDEAAEEGLVPDGGTIEDRLRAGQYLERHRVFGCVVEMLREQAEEAALNIAVDGEAI